MLTSCSKTTKTLILAILLFVMMEGVLQIRSHIRYGQSVFNLLSEQTTFVIDEHYKLKLLRADSIIEGSQATIQTNELGLRDRPIAVPKPAQQFRIAIVGASSVMGTYTKSNADTLPARLEELLNRNQADIDYRVINAGIAGHSIGAQRKMVAFILSDLYIDLFIWYPGFNDISGYCKPANIKKEKADFSLPQLSLPKWLLSVDLLIKNTVMLRTPKSKNSDKIDPQTLDSTNFANNVDAFLNQAEQLNTPVFVVTNARAFREEMSLEQQLSLSETSRYYNSCFDLAGLHTVFDSHNELIKQRARTRGLPVMMLNEQMAGGTENFGDATHFSVKGTIVAAEAIKQGIIAAGLVPYHPKLSKEASR